MGMHSVQEVLQVLAGHCASELRRLHCRYMGSKSAVDGCEWQLDRWRSL